MSFEKNQCKQESNKIIKNEDNNNKEKENELNNVDNKDKNKETEKNNDKDNIENKEKEENKKETIQNEITENEVNDNNKSENKTMERASKNAKKEDKNKNTRNNKLLKEKEFKNTEEFLEYNLSPHNSKINNNEEEIKENQEKEEVKNDKPLDSDNQNDSSNMDHPNKIMSKRKKNSKINIQKPEKQKEEIIFIKQIIPISYICKIRQKNIKINNLIPKKKRLFVTKKISPKESEESKNKYEDKIEIIPISSLCFTTKNALIKGKIKYLTSVNNNYCFYTKIYTNKESEKKNENEKNNDLKNGDGSQKKYPCKIYRKAIISPGKINLFRTNKKLAKIKKNRHDSASGIGEENMAKRIKKKEKISLVSKDKSEVYSSQKEDSKDLNNKIIVKDKFNNNNEFSDDNDANRIDISIQFSNTPLNIDYNNENNNILKKNKNKNKFNSTSKKDKNITDSLYKDLREINNKLENRNDYFKKHHYNLEYQKHYGDEKTCPICKEMRKKGKRMEKEKGLFSAFSFRNYKKINKKTLNKLKLSQLQKTQNSKKMDLLSDDERKKNNVLDVNNYNHISKENSDFRKKYLQFNGMNKLNRFNRYGSVGNFMKYRNNYSRNDYNNLRNEKKLNDKSEEVYNNSEYPVLKNYFHDDNIYNTNDYFY